MEKELKPKLRGRRGQVWGARDVRDDFAGMCGKQGHQRESR